MAKEKTHKKVKDKWKAKEWYRVIAPPMFNNAVIAETMADEPGKLRNRIVETTMQEMSGDASKAHLKLYFQIDSVKGNEAYTQFIGHSLTSDYIRRLGRKSRTKIDEIYNVITKDERRLILKIMALAEKKIQSSQETSLRNIIKKTVESTSKTKTLNAIVRDITSGGISSSIFSKCKPIYPLKRVEVRASEVILGKGGEVEDAASSKTEPLEKKTEQAGKTEEKMEAQHSDIIEETEATENKEKEPESVMPELGKETAEK